MVRFAIALLLVGLVFSPAAFAEDEPEAAGQVQKKPPTVLEKLIKELKGMVARETAQPEHDKDLLKDIQSLIKSFEKLAKKEAEEEARRKVDLDDLSEEDRAALREQMREELRKEFAEGRGEGEGGEEGGGGGGDWAEREKNRRIEKVLEDVKLKEEQRAAVEEMLGDFISDAYAATRNGDAGLVNDLKKDLEKRLRREVGGTKAKQIINNVNRNLPRRGWGR